jgi:hypothetical protein
MIRNVPKIDVEQIKGSGEFLPLFIPLGHLVQISFSRSF